MYLYNMYMQYTCSIMYRYIKFGCHEMSLELYINDKITLFSEYILVFTNLCLVNLSR